MVKISLLLRVWTFKATGFELNQGFVSKVIFQKPYFKKIESHLVKRQPQQKPILFQTFYLGIHTKI